MDVEKKKNAVRGILRIAILIMIAALILFVLLNYQKIRPERILGIFTGQKNENGEPANAISFSPDSTNTFEPYLDGLAVMSSTGLSIIEPSGNEKLVLQLSAARPVLKCNGPYLVAYDVGGKRLVYINEYISKMNQMYSSMILTCALNKNGWLVVAAEESGSKATVSAYNANMTEVYKWYSSERYITCTTLADDNTGMAVGGLRQEKARIVSSVVLLRFDSEEPYASVDIPDVLILDMKFLPDGSLAVMTEDSLVIMNQDGSERGRYDFDAKLLKEYSLDGENELLLRLSKNGVGETSELIFLNFDATVGRQMTLKNVISSGCNGKFTGVLTSDHIIVYNSLLEEQYSSPITAGSKKLLMRSDGTALVLSSAEALIYR